MRTVSLENLEQELSVLGKSAHLSLTQRQKVRDKLFKQIGQLDLIDSMQTKTESLDLVMPVNKLQNIFRPRRIMLSLPATVGLIATVFIATFTTGAIARDAAPGEPLFGVRKAFETVQVMLTRDPVQRASLQLSIAGERIANLENVDPKKLDAVLQESQKAIATAQSSVAALQTADETSAQDLVAKLKAIVDNQRSILSTIVKDNLNNEDIKKSVTAVRNELNTILPPESEGTTNSESAADNDSFYGFIITAYGQPALNMNGVIYTLVNSPADLTGYIGVDNVTIVGRVIDGNKLTVYKIIIDGKLIGENNPFVDSNLSRVEGGPN